MLFATNSGAREKMRLLQQEKQIRPVSPERATTNGFANPKAAQLWGRIRGLITTEGRQFNPDFRLKSLAKIFPLRYTGMAPLIRYVAVRSP